MSSPGPFTSSVHQSENPAVETVQTIERTTEIAYPPPAVPAEPSSQSAALPAGGGTIPPAPSAGVVTRTTERIETSIGAAQRDTAREISAKLGAVRWVQILGALMILGGISTFHPAVKLFVQSKTVTAGLFAAGAGLIFLPFVIVGNELALSMIGGGVILAGLVYFLGQRNAKHKATAEFLERIRPATP